MCDRFIASYLIYPNPKLDDGKWVAKYLNFLFIGMVGHEGKSQGIERVKKEKELI